MRRWTMCLKTIKFFDTAGEMYSVPPKAETYGATEAIIGNWFEKSGKRKDVILATKIAGPGMARIRCERCRPPGTANRLKRP